jgi:hypothetical protein
VTPLLAGNPAAVAVHDDTVVIADASEHGGYFVLARDDGRCLYRCSSEGEYAYDITSAVDRIWIAHQGHGDEGPILSVQGLCLQQTACE